MHWVVKKSRLSRNSIGRISLSPPADSREDEDHQIPPRPNGPQATEDPSRLEEAREWRAVHHLRQRAFRGSSGYHVFSVSDGGESFFWMCAIHSSFSFQVLAKSRVVAGDGTFKAKPGKMWSQVYVLHALIEKGSPSESGIEARFVPVAAAFLGKATTGAYLILLQGLYNWIRTHLGRRWQPEKFLSDFEAAQRAAISRFFEGNAPQGSLLCLNH